MNATRQTEALQRRIRHLEKQVAGLQAVLAKKDRSEQDLVRAEARFRQIIDSTSEGFVLLDPGFLITDVNRSLLKILGYRREEIIGLEVSQLYDDGTRDFHFASREHLSIEVQLLTRHGEKVPFLFNRSVLRNSAGILTGYVGFFTNLTELKIIEHEKQKIQQRYRDIYENAVQGMFQCSPSGRYISVNPAYARMLGYRPEELLAMKDVANTLYFDPRERQRNLDTVNRVGEIRDREVKLRRKDGTAIWVIAYARKGTDEKGRPIIEGIMVDHTERKKAQEKLKKSEARFRYLAIHDNLTGLYNTRYLYQALEKLSRQSRKSKTPFSLIFMDIDNFKRVVDTHGHLKGSRTLQQVAGTIRETIREPAFGVSYGGDEFVIVLPGMDKDRALQQTRDLRRRILESVYLIDAGLNIKLTASFGIATFPDDADDVKGLLALADQALFRVKEGGKDGIFATLELEQEALSVPDTSI